MRRTRKTLIVALAAWFALLSAGAPGLHTCGKNRAPAPARGTTASCSCECAVWPRRDSHRLLLSVRGTPCNERKAATPRLSAAADTRHDGGCLACRFVKSTTSDGVLAETPAGTFEPAASTLPMPDAPAAAAASLFPDSRAPPMCAIL